MQEGNQLADLSINLDDEITTNNYTTQMSPNQSPANLASFYQMLQGHHSTPPENFSARRRGIQELLQQLAHEPQLDNLSMILEEEFPPSPTQLSYRSPNNPITRSPFRLLQGQHKSELADPSTITPKLSSARYFI